MVADERKPHFLLQSKRLKLVPVVPRDSRKHIGSKEKLRSRCGEYYIISFTRAFDINVNVQMLLDPAKEKNVGFVTSADVYATASTAVVQQQPQRIRRYYRNHVATPGCCRSEFARHRPEEYLSRPTLYTTTLVKSVLREVKGLHMFLEYLRQVGHFNPKGFGIPSVLGLGCPYVRYGVQAKDDTRKIPLTLTLNLALMAPAER